jgi:hypothetical protein
MPTGLSWITLDFGLAFETATLSRWDLLSPVERLHRRPPSATPWFFSLPEADRTTANLYRHDVARLVMEAMVSAWGAVLGNVDITQVAKSTDGAAR